MPARRARILAALAVAAAVALVAGWSAWHHPELHRDFDQTWFSARALLRGVDPYPLVGPGGEFPWPWPLYYPATAFVVVFPLAPLPVNVARVVFITVSCGLCAMALTRDGWFRWPLLISFSALATVLAGQWSPLLTAAAVYPALAWVAVAKPIGAALVVAHREPRRAWPVMAVGGAVVLGVSLALLPGWPAEWVSAVRHAKQNVPPVVRPGGALLLLALLRWRRPEARVLLAIALAPATPGPHEAVPLFLIASTQFESLGLALLTYANMALLMAAVTARPAMPIIALSAIVGVWTYYVPCLVMVLRRPNEGSAPAWMERLAARADRLVRREPAHAGGREVL